MPNVDDSIRQLAERIRQGEPRESLDAEVRALSELHGEWVRESLVDMLTDSTDTYSQHLQDTLYSSGVEISPQQTERLEIVSLEAFGDSLTGNWAMILTLTELVPSDWYALPREAKLSRVEADVWGFWLQQKEIADIQVYVLRNDGRPYSTRYLRACLSRAIHKVENCDSLGWRTALAEDRHRGRCHKMPKRVSPAEIIHHLSED